MNLPIMVGDVVIVTKPVGSSGIYRGWVGTVGAVMVNSNSFTVNVALEELPTHVFFTSELTKLNRDDVKAHDLSFSVAELCKYKDSEAAARKIKMMRDISKGERKWK